MEHLLYAYGGYEGLVYVLVYVTVIFLLGLVLILSGFLIDSTEREVQLREELRQAQQQP